MILYYALGGGLGHLSRARAVAHTLGLSDVTVLSASPFARDPRVRGPLEVLPVPRALEEDPQAFGRFLLDAVLRLRPAALFVDAFPGGILGELCDLPLPADLPCYHLARLLRLPVYGRRLRGRLPRYRRSYLLEPLPAAQLQLLRGCSEGLAPLDLADPEGPDGPAAAPIETGGRPLWLVVHSEPEGEIAALLADAERDRRAEDPAARLCLVSPMRPADLPGEVLHLDRYPAAPLFSQADRIYTACGFNAMRETAAHRARHRFRPFPRRLDDQHLRARLHRGA